MYSYWGHREETKIGLLDVAAIRAYSFLEYPFADPCDCMLKDASILLCMLDMISHIPLHAHLPEVALVDSAVGTGTPCEGLETCHDTPVDVDEVRSA